MSLRRRGYAAAMPRRDPEVGEEPLLDFSSGYVQRAAHLLPQLSGPRQFSWEQTMQGLWLILFGLFKKIAIANGVAGSVNAVYGSSGTASWRFRTSSGSALYGGFGIVRTASITRMSGGSTR